MAEPITWVGIMKYLPVSKRPEMRRKLQAAYRQPTYEKAKAALRRMRSELALMNQSAAKSLDEGLEETLGLGSYACHSRQQT